MEEKVEKERNIRKREKRKGRERGRVNLDPRRREKILAQYGVTA